VENRKSGRASLFIGRPLLRKKGRPAKRELTRTEKYTRGTEGKRELRTDIKRLYSKGGKEGDGIRAEIFLLFIVHGTSRTCWAGVVLDKQLPDAQKSGRNIFRYLEGEGHGQAR